MSPKVALKSAEAVSRRCSVKKVFLEILQNSQENTCGKDSFLIKLQTSPCNFIKKETLAQVLFSFEFCEISKSTFFYRTPAMAVPKSVTNMKMKEGTMKRINSSPCKSSLNKGKTYSGALRQDQIMSTLVILSKCSHVTYAFFIARFYFQHVKFFWTWVWGYLLKLKYDW